MNSCLIKLPQCPQLLLYRLLLSLKNMLRLLLSLKKSALAIFMVLAHVTAFAQHDTSHQMAVYDSLKSDADSVNTGYRSATQGFINRFQRLGVEELQKSIVEYHEDTIITKQDEIIEQVKELTAEAKSYLKNGLDTTGLTEQLKKLEDWYNITSDGIFISFFYSKFSWRISN